MECSLSVKSREEALEQVKELNNTGFIEFSLTETEDGWNLTARGDSEKAETFLKEKKIKQVTMETEAAIHNLLEKAERFRLYLQLEIDEDDSSISFWLSAVNKDEKMFACINYDKNFNEFSLNLYSEVCSLDTFYNLTQVYDCREVWTIDDTTNDKGCYLAINDLMVIMSILKTLVSSISN